MNSCKHEIKVNSNLTPPTHLKFSLKPQVSKSFKYKL